MPQPRRYKSNADRQKAYRDRKRAALEATPTDGRSAVVARVMAADKQARG